MSALTPISPIAGNATTFRPEKKVRPHVCIRRTDLPQCGHPNLLSRFLFRRVVRSLHLLVLTAPAPHRNRSLSPCIGNTRMGGAPQAIPVLTWLSRGSVDRRASPISHPRITAFAPRLQVSRHAPISPRGAFRHERNGRKLVRSVSAREAPGWHPSSSAPSVPFVMKSGQLYQTARTAVGPWRNGSVPDHEIYIGRPGRDNHWSPQLQARSTGVDLGPTEDSPILMASERTLPWAPSWWAV